MNPFEKDWGTSVDVDVNVQVTTKPKKPIPDRKSYCADITIIMDKSGSMGNLRESVVAGLNKYFVSMKDKPGENLWSMVQFDDPDSARGAGEAFPNVVFERRSEKDLTELTMSDFQERGFTALNDGVCKTIHQIDARCSGQWDNYKPIVMIVTDGGENASKEFTTPQTRELIANRQSKGWEFLFLAANQDAWSTAGQYGMANANISNYNYAGQSVLSGAVTPGSVNAFTFQATGRGIFDAICSGMIGVAHMSSGSLASCGK